MTAWIDTSRGQLEFNPGNDAPFQVNISANQPVTIEKLYGPLVAMSVRVRLEYRGDIADWVVESEKIESTPDGSVTVWVERARWGCQDGLPPED